MQRIRPDEVPLDAGVLCNSARIPFSHYARSDVVRLVINREPLPRVQEMRRALEPAADRATAPDPLSSS